MRVALTLLLLVWLGTAGAQYTEDEQTQDQREQDQRYYERYLEQASAPDRRPPEDASAAAAAYLARADELIRDLNYNAHDSEHYRVQTDDPRIDPAASTSLLESFRGFFEEFWNGRVELRPYAKRSRVFLFYSFYKFKQLISTDWTFRVVRPAGHYRGEFDVIALHTDAGAPEDVADALVHEAAHQLLEQRLLSADEPPPAWLSEGLATYFGNTLLDEQGRFHAGEIGGKAIALFRDGKVRRGDGPKRALKAFRKEAKHPQVESRPVERILTIPDAAFYGEGVQSNYAAAWMLVHFLFEAQQGRHRQAFVEFATGQDGSRYDTGALCRAVGLTLAELEAAVERHAAELNAR